MPHIVDNKSDKVCCALDDVADSVDEVWFELGLYGQYVLLHSSGLPGLPFCTRISAGQSFKGGMKTRHARTCGTSPGAWVALVSKRQGKRAREQQSNVFMINRSTREKRTELIIARARLNI
jgi:hypothetical protein